VTKTQKPENQKSSKMTKCKIRKVKKWQKMVPPLKTPKCQINGTFSHFVFSEPPGWALFRFQGVPRDPVLRPKIDPPYFWWFLTLFHVLRFHILMILMILCLWHFGESGIFQWLTFFDMFKLHNVIRPYSKMDVMSWRIHRRGDWCSVVVSPLMFFWVCCFWVLLILLSGRIHRRGDIYYSRSPLCVFCFVYMSTFYNSDDGEIHRKEEIFVLSFSPLWFLIYEYVCGSCILHVGEIHRVVFLINSRSPLYKTQILILTTFGATTK